MTAFVFPILLQMLMNAGYALIIVSKLVGTQMVPTPVNVSQGTI